MFYMRLLLLVLLCVCMPLRSGVAVSEDADAQGLQERIERRNAMLRWVWDHGNTLYLTVLMTKLLAFALSNVQDGALDMRYSLDTRMESTQLEWMKCYFPLQWGLNVMLGDDNVIVDYLMIAQAAYEGVFVMGMMVDGIYAASHEECRETGAQCLHVADWFYRKPLEWFAGWLFAMPGMWSER